MTRNSVRCSQWLVGAGRTERLAEVPSLCFAKLIDWREWGFVWPAVFLAIPMVLAKGTGRERAGALTTGLALIAYSSIFYFTNWPVPQHIYVAYDRLLEHLAPMAVLILIMAYVRLGGATPTIV